MATMLIQAATTRASNTKAKSVCLFIADSFPAIGSPVERRKRSIRVIPNTPHEVAKIAKRLSRHGKLEFCYEAGGCGYGIYRQLSDPGHKCTVVASSMIPRKPGERIKTDRRDSQELAILHRSGDLTAVWVRDPTHEALRDLVRARVDASMHLMRARRQLLAFLYRHGLPIQPASIGHQHAKRKGNHTLFAGDNKTLQKRR